MAKTFEILSIDTPRSVMLIRFEDGATIHDTEIPFPPQLDTPDPGDADLSKWILSFWPHSIMERPSVFPLLAGKVGLSKDITAQVPLPAATLGKVP